MLKETDIVQKWEVDEELQDIRSVNEDISSGFEIGTMILDSISEDAFRKGMQFIIDKINEKNIKIFL